MTKRFVTVLVVVLALLALSVGPAWAQEGDSPGIIEEDDIPALPAFLSFVASPPGAVIVGVVVSMYLARWPWYNRQSDEVKKLIAYGGTVLIAGLAYVAVSYIPDTFWASIAPYWVIVVFCAFAIFGNQGWFQLAIKKTRRPSFAPEPLTLSEGGRHWQLIGEDLDESNGMS